MHTSANHSQGLQLTTEKRGVYQILLQYYRKRAACGSISLIFFFKLTQIHYFYLPGCIPVLDLF